MADTEVGAGLLFYTYQDQLIRVSQSKNELRGLVQARNELARYASMRSDLSLARAKGLRDELDEDASIEPQSDVLSSDIEDGLLPEPIDDAHWCKRCYAVDACMLYRKVCSTPLYHSARSLSFNQAIDAKPHNSSTPSEDIVNLYESKTSHLSKQHTEFFSEWEHLINLEEREAARNRKEIWTMTAEERQQAGRLVVSFCCMFKTPLNSGAGVLRI